ncbi:MAG: AraC-like DNA-binding protein [Saprospiraceae bacterium]|jgi:AraC-like DNA-binding protein|tara:strand:+ start:1047 stop:1904 length:858 start_codon:yes stop_codon:yes gene_type:complete
MKPEYEKIIDKPEQSFTARLVKRTSRSKLSQAWHYHPEIEICYTVKSKGRRFVGNQISDYTEYDLAMFGSNLPHGFVTNEESNQIVIQMNEDFLGGSFLLKPELRDIQRLFSYAKRGIEFGDITKKKCASMMELILNSDRMTQLIHLLSLLNYLSQATDSKAICSEEYALDVNVSQFNRLTEVYDHVMNNYREEVNISDISKKINLSEAGFYKFIKKQTKKSYTQIINEFRINNACKQLIDSSKTISEISYESGFNNQSYFNRKFKSIMSATPLEYRYSYSRLDK